METIIANGGTQITTLDNNKRILVTDADGKQYYITPADDANELMKLMPEATLAQKGLLAAADFLSIPRVVGTRNVTSYTNFASFNRLPSLSCVIFIDAVIGNRFIEGLTIQDLRFTYDKSNSSPIISFITNKKDSAFRLYYKLDGDIVRFYIPTSINMYSRVSISCNCLAPNSVGYLSSTEGLIEI